MATANFTTKPPMLIFLKADEQTTEDLFDEKIDRSTPYNVVNKPAAGGVERGGRLEKLG
jgi:hypothetical protein